MALTPTQLTAFKNSIASDAALNALPQTPDAAFTIATAYNVTAAPDFWVWRTRVTRDEYMQKPSADGTTFVFTGTGWLSRSQGERDAWNMLFEPEGVVNASLAGVRQAFNDIFSGSTAPAPANRAHLLAVSRRKATRAEKVFSTGTGSTAAPAVMGYEGAIMVKDVQDARKI